jgi:lysophospholipase L1-like esterase
MQHPTDPTRLIVMGDSISTGTGASMPPLSYYALLSANANATWPTAMSTDLATHYGHAVPVLDVAVGGATTSTMRSNQIPSLRTRLPPPVMGHSIVVITIGGNDLQAVIASGGDPAGAPLDTAVQNIRTVITYLRDPANFPDGTSIYLAAVYDPSDGEGQISMSQDHSAMTCFFGLSLPAFIPALDAWRARYIGLGQELHFSVIDALGYFHGHGHNYMHTDNPYYHADDPTYWFYDCIHPNDRGHHELRRIFYEAIDPTYMVP